MRKEIKIETRQEVLSLVTDVPYSIVPDWYNGTYRTLKMNLIIPKHREQHAAQPCLLFLCGGAFAVVNGSIWMPELEFFARRGYTVATIEYRTSNQAQFPEPLIDAKTAVRFLKANAAKFCIDPAKIFIAGESAGGALCSMVGTTAGVKEFDVGEYTDFDSSVAGVIDYYGLVDMTTSSSKESEDSRIAYWAMEAYLGVRYDRETAEKASAIHYVCPDTPPFMILHGTADELVNIDTQSEVFYRKLTENGVYTEYYRLTGEQHGVDAFYQPEIKQLILNFMNKVTEGKASE